MAAGAPIFATAGISELLGWREIGRFCWGWVHCGRSGAHVVSWESPPWDGFIAAGCADVLSCRCVGYGGLRGEAGDVFSGRCAGFGDFGATVAKTCCHGEQASFDVDGLGGWPAVVFELDGRRRAVRDGATNFRPLGRWSDVGRAGFPTYVREYEGETSLEISKFMFGDDRDEKDSAAPKVRMDRE